MDKYRYDGCVMEFDRCIANHWVGETTAISPSKAKSNLTYRFKQQTGRTASSKITLPGKIEKVERSYI